MTTHLDAATPGLRPAPLVLPPAFTGLVAAGSPGAAGQACRLAESGEAEAGTLLMEERDDVIALSVVLAPTEPLATARRAFFVGMQALADAVGTFGPPEIPVTFLWPDTLIFNGARLGGGALHWPQGCDEAEIPDWLVFSAMLIATKRAAGDPGLTPDSTSLEEEGFPDGLREPLVESFARHLTKAFEIWNEDGAARSMSRYLARLALAPGARASIETGGDARLVHAHGRSELLPLLPALLSPSWRDPATDTVRL
ncbi:biotin/lipoate--protein ligase family protein [Methylorubrum thiocyanatum]|uniref:biotin/lipoate--protein ligase family protein n=1 Tax=Methylorubrum thiocyanatum TaxID=47958 RepID=UPI00398C450A